MKIRVWSRDGGICQLCFTAVPLDVVTMDHVVPSSLGGKDTFANFRAAHRKCNEKRGNNDEGPSFPGTHTRRREARKRQKKRARERKKAAENLEFAVVKVRTHSIRELSTDERIALQKRDEDEGNGRYSG